MATIAFFDTATWEPSYVRRHIGALFGHKLLFFPEPIGETHLEKLKDVDVISLFVQSKLTAEIVRQLPNLRMVALRSTGFDHVDLIECAKHGIVVCNVPAYGENTVAEHTFGLLLCLARHIHISNERNKENNFTIKDLVGFDLKKKTIGIIGGGRIGLNAAKIARGFGMNVLIFDLYQNPFSADSVGFTYATLDTIYQTADIISLHLPYSESTRHIISMKVVKKLKKGVILINTSRGALVETDALLYGLEKGIIAKAGLDVLEEEEYLTHPHAFDPKHPEHTVLLEKNRKIISMPNVLYTPHNAFNTTEALQRIEQTTLDNIKSFLRGKTQNQVKPQ